MIECPAVLGFSLWAFWVSILLKQLRLSAGNGIVFIYANTTQISVVLMKALLFTSCSQAPSGGRPGDYHRQAPGTDRQTDRQAPGTDRQTDRQAGPGD